MKLATVLAISGFAILLTTGMAWGHGYGGARSHSGGAEGGYHGESNSGANRSAGSSESNRNRSAEGGGYHPNNETGNMSTGGYHAGSETGAAASSGYHPEAAQGYPAAHTAQPTDAGYGYSNADKTAAAYGAKGTQPMNNAAMADQGDAVRKNYNGTGTYNQSWYGAHPDAWHASGWSAGDEWHTGSWAAVAPAAGVTTAAQPVPYNYGYACAPPQGAPGYPVTQTTPSGNPDYQQASMLAQARRRPTRSHPLGRRWEFLRSCEILGRRRIT